MDPSGAFLAFAGKFDGKLGVRLKDQRRARGDRSHSDPEPAREGSRLDAPALGSLADRARPQPFRFAVP